jgi:alcohol dehydrogenase class IV
VISSFGFYRTPRLRFGAGEYRNTAKYAASFGKNALVVTGHASLRRSGRHQQLCDSLKENAFTYSLVEIETEPSPEAIDSIVAAFRDKRISSVIGVGGGSVIDAGKAIAAMLPLDGSVFDYLEGVGHKTYPGGRTNYLAVPTTSGTGSEATANAVLSRIGNKGFKKSLRHDSLVPDLAIIDPELSLSCSPEVTAACGMDAFSQLLESYVSKQASPMTDDLAFGGLKCVSHSLLRAFTDGRDDITVRASMAYASFISGITLANAGLGIVHGMASALGGLFTIPHGVVCGSLLAASMKATVEKLKKEPEQNQAAMRKFANVGALFDRCASDDVEGGCSALIEKLYEMTERLEMPYLSDFGIAISDIDRIVKQSGNKNNPIALDPTDIAAILRERIERKS